MTCKNYPCRLLVSHSTFFFILVICQVAKCLVLQTLNPYFVQMHLSFFLFHSWWCLSIREPRQSIDPFEVMSHQSSPSSFLQSYCECRLNDQKGELEVGVQGCVCRFDCLECILNNQIDFWCVTYDHLICCEFVFIYFFSIYNFKF